MKKILYTFYHGAAFAWALVHKLAFHPEDEASLLVADGWDWCAGNHPLVSTILSFAECGVFRNVYTYDNRLGRDKEEYDTLEKTEQAILEGINKCLQQQGCDIEEFDEIYSNTDGEDTLGIYLSLKQKAFFWYEFGPNLLSLRDKKWVENTYKDFGGYKPALLKHETLFGRSSLQSYLVYPGSDTGDFPKERVTVVDIEAAAKGLSKENKDLILRCFQLENAACPSSSTMLLLQSNWLPSQVYAACEQIQKKFKHHWLYMYFSIQCMLDYYLPKGSIPVLKTHPTVSIEEKTAERYFNGAFAFPALFTVLLTKSLLPEYRPQYRMLLGSSSNRQLTEKKEDIYCPGVWLFSLFCHKYFMALHILDFLGALDKHSPKHFETIGRRGTIMNYNFDCLPLDIAHMMKVQFPDVREASDIRYTVVQIWDTELDKKICENDFVVFTDVWEEMDADKRKQLSEWGNVLELTIRKEQIKKKEDILDDLEDEKIYLVSKSARWHKKMQGYTAVKENVYGGITLKAEKTGFWEFCPQKSYPVGSAINLLECYSIYGRTYCNERGDEIKIEGTVTTKAMDNMKAVTVKFSGEGGNLVVFRDLDTSQRISENFRVEALNGGQVEIGKFLFANAGVLVHASNASVVIDDDVMCDSGVVIKAVNYHSVYEEDGTRLKNKDLYIGKHVWLDYDSTVYAGAVIGAGTVVEAGSTVYDRIPNNCLVRGNPARIVKRDIFWSWKGVPENYYDLPKEWQTADLYIAKTDE